MRDLVGQKLKFLFKMIGFEAHEGAELTIKNVLIGNYCYSIYYQYSVDVILEWNIFLERQIVLKVHITILM